MKNFIKAAIVLVVFLVAAAGVRALALRNSEPTYSASEVAELRTEFIKSCATDPNNIDYCACTIDYMLEDMGINRVIELGLEYEETNKIPEELLPAVSACLDRMQ